MHFSTSCPVCVTPYLRRDNGAQYYHEDTCIYLCVIMTKRQETHHFPIANRNLVVSYEVASIISLVFSFGVLLAAF